MEARLLEINSQIEKMILLLGGKISQEVQAEDVQAEQVQNEEVQTEQVQTEQVHAVEEQAEEEQAEVIQAEEVQAEAVQEFKEDSMPEEEKQEHPHLPAEPCFAAVPESPELVEYVAPLPEKTPEEELEVLIVEVIDSRTKNEDPEALADDHETAEEIFKKAAEAGLAVRQ